MLFGDLKSSTEVVCHLGIGRYVSNLSYLLVRLNSSWPTNLNILQQTLTVIGRRLPYNIQNGNLLDLTCENDDICNSVVVVNGVDTGKVSPKGTGPFLRYANIVSQFE